MSNVIDLFAAFAVNADAEKDGTYTQLPGCGDTEFLIARTQNIKYTTALQKAAKRNKPVLDSGGEAARNKSDEILADVLSKTILLGWKGTIKYKGADHPYSQEMAKTLLSLRDFREAVTAVADSMETFKAVQDEEEAKN